LDGCGAKEESMEVSTKKPPSPFLASEALARISGMEERLVDPSKCRVGDIYPVFLEGTYTPITRDVVYLGPHVLPASAKASPSDFSGVNVFLPEMTCPGPMTLVVPFHEANPRPGSVTLQCSVCGFSAIIYTRPNTLRLPQSIQTFDNWILASMGDTAELVSGRYMRCFPFGSEEQYVVSVLEIGHDMHGQMCFLALLQSPYTYRVAFQAASRQLEDVLEETKKTSFNIRRKLGFRNP
jgi:hypothetical protein